jgi:type II secretory pathway component PulM
MKIPTFRKKVLVIAIAVVAAVAFYAYAIKPAIERTNTLKRILPEKQHALQQLQVKSRQYLALHARLAGIDLQTEQSEALTILDTITAQSGTAKNVAYMKKQSLPVDSKYNQTVAELRFENITLNQLVDFLFKAQSSTTPLQIKSLYIEKSRTNQNMLNCVLQISTLTANLSA